MPTKCSWLRLSDKDAEFLAYVKKRVCLYDAAHGPGRVVGHDVDRGAAVFGSTCTNDGSGTIGSTTITGWRT